MPAPTYRGVTASIVVHDADKAIALYQTAFGAQETFRMAHPKTGKILHACLTIQGTELFVCDADEAMGIQPTRNCFYLYVENADTSFTQAKHAGFKEIRPLSDMFWGDRNGMVQDGFGNLWTIATHQRDVSPEELEAGRQKIAA